MESPGLGAEHFMGWGGGQLKAEPEASAGGTATHADTQRAPWAED